ncbi:hypothetical protein C6P76_13925 [Burkholderia multivorans]|nr:hypothetical protein C6P76_13925 [Burkholderia multivorans]
MLLRHLLIAHGRTLRRRATALSPPSRSSVYTVRASSWGALFDCAYRWEGIREPCPPIPIHCSTGFTRERSCRAQ